MKSGYLPYKFSLNTSVFTQFGGIFPLSPAIKFFVAIIAILVRLSIVAEAE